MPTYSSLLESIKPSGTVAVSDKFRQLQQDGVFAINLGGGDPNFPTPAHIAKAGIDAINSGQTHYVASRGLPATRQAVADKFKRENGLTYNPDKEIIVTASGKLALYLTFLGIVNPGDEVLIIEPAWVSYVPIVELVGGTPVAVPLSPENNFTLTKEILKAAVTPKTKAVLLNSPNNPSGRVINAKEMEALCQVAIEHDLWVVSDEMYEHLMFDNNKHLSPASYPGMWERCITVNGFSKAYAMTGWRLGYLGAPAGLVTQILKGQQHIINCAPSFAQIAGAEALNGPQDCVAQMLAEYDKRRVAMVKALNEIPGVRCPDPEGAFYLFPEISFRGYDSWQLTDYLLDTAHVCVIPGQTFGSKAVHNVRMTFAKSMDDLMKGAELIAKALK